MGLIFNLIFPISSGAEDRSNESAEFLPPVACPIAKIPDLVLGINQHHTYKKIQESGIEVFSPNLS